MKRVGRGQKKERKNAATAVTTTPHHTTPAVARPNQPALRLPYPSRPGHAAPKKKKNNKHAYRVLPDRGVCIGACSQHPTPGGGSGGHCEQLLLLLLLVVPTSGAASGEAWC